MAKTEADLSEDDVVLAGELALGVLEGADLAAAQQRRIAEPAFARAVERWHDHFATAALQGPAVAPPAGIEARLLAAVQAGEESTVVAFPRRVARRWRVAATACAAVAAAVALVLLRPAAHDAAPVDTAQPVLVAALDVAADHTVVLARVAPGELRLAPGLAVPAQHDAQAWVIDGSGPPRSLGVLHRAGQALTVAPQRAVRPGQTLAVSIEPLGGAPGALPTGPVVAVGKIQAI